MAASPSPVVFITGASSGIGHACAHHLHGQGYRVYGTSRTPGQHTALPFHLLPMDVTDEESVRVAVDTVSTQAGGIDVLVNNAGMGIAGAVEVARLRYTVGPLPQRVAASLKGCVPHRLLEWVLMTYYKIR